MVPALLVALLLIRQILMVVHIATMSASRGKADVPTYPSERLSLAEGVAEYFALVEAQDRVMLAVLDAALIRMDGSVDSLVALTT